MDESNEQLHKFLTATVKLSTNWIQLLWEVRQIIVHCGVRILVFSVTLRNATTAVCTYDYEVE